MNATLSETVLTGKTIEMVPLMLHFLGTGLKPGVNEKDSAKPHLRIGAFSFS
jgi:hypothetical protein